MVYKLRMSRHKMFDCICVKVTHQLICPKEKIRNMTCLAFCYVCIDWSVKDLFSPESEATVPHSCHSMYAAESLITVIKCQSMQHNKTQKFLSFFAICPSLSSQRSRTFLTNNITENSTLQTNTHREAHMRTNSDKRLIFAVAVH